MRQGTGSLCVVMLQELGGVLHPLMGMELWGSKTYFSMSQACGDGCNGGGRRGSHLAVMAPCETCRVFHAAFQVPEKQRTWEPLVFGQHPEDHSSWLSLSCPWGPADPLLCPGSSVCLLTPLPITVWISAA